MADEQMAQPNMQQRIASIDRVFRKLEIKTSDIVEEKQPKPQEAAARSKNFNSRGQVILSSKEIRENYANAMYFFKWYQLPFCRSTIKRKISFWAPTSVILAWMYGEYHKKKSPLNAIERLPFKFYLKAYAVIFSVTSVYCIAESMLFDEFCDIQSPIYQENQTRLSLAKRIRAQIKGSKDAGFLREMF